MNKHASTLENPLVLGPGELVNRSGVWSMNLDAYHQQICDGPSISSSGLRTIWSESPAHYWATSALNPDREPEDDKPHYTLGRLAHRLLLEGREGFDREFVTRPEKWKDWRTDAAKQWRVDMEAAGLTVITNGDLETVTGMAKSLGAHPMVKAGILDGYVERSMIYRDPATGVWLKARPDNVTSHSADLSDLKTTVSVGTEELRRTLGGYGYHMQAALAGAALKATTGVEMETFTFVWVEKAPPYCVRVTTLTPEDLLRGWMQVEAATRIFAECVGTGRWPGPGGDQQDAEFLSIPPWAAKTIDDRLEVLKATAPTRTLETIE